MSDTLRDIRIAFRRLRARPGFTLISLSVLAIGTGATTAIFSVMHAVVIRPLPFPEPDRLVQVFESHLNEGFPRFSVSQPNAFDLKRMVSQLQSVGVWGSRSATLTAGGEPQQVSLGQVTPGFFKVLGVTPTRGRTFLDGDVGPDGPGSAVLISQALWTTRFGADPNVVGQTLEVDSEALEIVGVVPGGGPWLGADAYVPMYLDPTASRSDHRWVVIGRLADGATIESAREELDAIAGALMEDYSDVDPGLGFVVDPASTWAAGDQLRRTLWILMGSTGVVLLIACMNLANLQLARTEERARQLTVRAALGASRIRLARELLTESMLVGVLGGVLGVLVAGVALRGLLALEPGNVPRIDQVAIDLPVLIFGLVVAASAGVLAGLLPAARASSADLASSLRAAGRRASASRRGSSARAWLVGMETALSVVLLVGAALLIRSLGAVQRIDNGFDPEHRVTFNVPVPASFSLDESRTFRAEFLRRLRANPQVVSAGAVNVQPLAGWSTSLNILPAEETPESFGGIPSADWRAISDDYFKAMGLSLVGGRDLEHVSPDDGDWEVVISQTLAERLFPDGDAVGRRVSLWNPPNAFGRVVGVVEDMNEQGPEQGPTSAVYFSYDRTRWTPVAFVVEAQADPAELVPDIRSTLAQVNFPVADVTTLDERVALTSSSRRFTMTLLVIFAALALTLALVGLFGVISQSVSQRSRELAIRTALGARSGQVVGLVMRHGMRPAAIGIGGGLLAAYLLSSVLEALLFGVSARDPLTYGVVAVLLAAAAALATWAPARGALRQTPAAVLRGE